MTYPRKWGQWFDTCKFSNVVPVWQGGPNMGFGNVGKDAVLGPGRVNCPASLYKSFAITRDTSIRITLSSLTTPSNHSEPNGLDTSYSPQNSPTTSTVLDRGSTSVRSQRPHLIRVYSNSVPVNVLTSSRLIASQPAVHEVTG